MYVFWKSGYYSIVSKAFSVLKYVNVGSQKNEQFEQIRVEINIVCVLRSFSHYISIENMTCFVKHRSKGVQKMLLIQQLTIRESIFFVV